MEVLASTIGVILAEPCRFVFGYVQASVKNFFKRKSNFITLKKEIHSLMDFKDTVKQNLDQQDQLDDMTRLLVRDWLKQVDELNRNVIAFLSTISTGDGNNLQNSCSPCPLQCKLSSHLATKIERVNHLMQAGFEVFAKMVDVRGKTNPVEHIPGPSIIGQTKASENLAKLSNLLNDNNVTRIGVYGMGGVGKTTLVRNLNNELRKLPSEQAFSIVIYVTVSKGANLRRIQTQIAERLNLKVNMKTNEENMAIRLHERLRKERRFLLILDDVWEEIALDRLGIPRQDLCPSCKIIITSRLLDVCRMMETQTDVQVKVLNDEESWELFHEHAGEVVMEEHIRPVAEMVSKECDGLPLAIIVVGASMRGKSMIELWEDTLRALQTSMPTGREIKDKVFIILKHSYDSLENNRVKFCFLFCCLYPEDFNINVDELVSYWYCEGLLDEHLNYKRRKNRGIAIIQSLRDCCLLEDGKYENTVKMHDVVRDVAIWIAESDKNECKSLVRTGMGLTIVPVNDLSSYKRVSFMCNKIVDLPDPMVNCQQVSTLLLQENLNVEGVPFSFLGGFHSLKILDLSQSSIFVLPHLCQLHQLRALLLRGCYHLKELACLDNLQSLLVFDCSHSGLFKLPESLERLRNLRQLDISYTDHLEIIPYTALSKLYNLESLKISSIGCGSQIEGDILFELLSHLENLIVFHAYMDSIPHRTGKTMFWFRRIKEFQITIGTGKGLEILQPNMGKNSVILSGLCLSEESIGWLLYNAGFLRIDGCEGLTQMFNKLVTHNVSFASLKTLKISKSDIIFGGGVASFNLLPNLEVIELEFLSELESVSDLSRLLGLKFSRLRWIIIDKCPQLKRVISLEENQTLEKLEMIEVSRCEMLESLFKYPRTPLGNLNPTAPNLREVKLCSLPKLESLWRNDESCQHLQLLKLFDCRGIRKLPLTAQNAESIKKIEGEEEWWNVLEWDNENTKMLLQNRFTPE